MAKRVSADEKPFHPVAEALTRSVMMPGDDLPPTSAPSPSPSQSNVVSIDAGNQKKSSTGVAKAEDKKKPTHVRRFILTDEENYALNQLATELGQRLGTPVNISHLLRATTTLMMNASDELLKQGEKMSGLKRPANNDAAALVAFEHNLTRLVERAIRNSKLSD